MDVVKARDVTWAQVVNVCHGNVWCVSSVYPPTRRHSRAGGNPGRQAPAFVTLDSRFRGNDGVGGERSG